MIIKFLISSILILSLMHEGLTQEILFQDDFEGYSLDTFPSDSWILAWNGTGKENQKIVNNQSVSPTQTLKLEGGINWAANAEILLSITPPIIYCEGNILVKNVNSSGHIEFKNQRIGTWGTYYVRVTIGDNGNITCNDSTILQRCEANKWYHIRIKYDSYLDLCDVWVDNILKGQGIECIKVGNYNAFSLTAHDTLVAPKVWFDNVIVYADSATMMLHSLYTGAKLYLHNEIDSAELYFEKARAYIGNNPDLQTKKYKPLEWLGNFQYLADKNDSVIIIKQKTYDWFIENGILFWAMYVSNELGLFYYENNKFSQAENYFQHSKKIFKEMIRIESCYKNDSVNYIETYDIKQYCSLQSGELKELMWIMGISTYYKLYQINEIKNRTEKAFKYYIQYSNARDTLVKLQRISDKNELLSSYENEQKLGNQVHVYEWLQQISSKSTKLEQTRYLLIGLGIIVILVILLAIVLILQNKLREQQKNLLLQQRLFRSQMNPHFIFNSLSSIQNTISSEEPITAIKFISRFSRLIRSILDSSVEEFITLDDEISTIENYLELQKVRFPEKFDYTIEVDENLDIENINVPSMLAQPFIENAIEHGIKHKISKGIIFIRFTLQNNSLVFEVEDNGVGREKAMEILHKQENEHKSHATVITLERIRVLNKKLKKNIMLQIQDLKNVSNDAIGTKVQISIPI